MTSINSMAGSSALPSAQALFEQASGAANGTPAAAQPTVAAPAPDPATLDQPDATYPALTTSHVAVLRAIGTPENVLQQLNAGQPQADYMDQYIQSEIMQNPEGWDDYVGNPRGTARAGLQKLVPGIQLPAAGQGNPGYVGDVSPATQPAGEAPASSGAEKLIKGLVIAGVVAGVGLLAWKFFKGRRAASAGSEAAEGAAKLLGGTGGGGLDLSKLRNVFSPDKADDATKLASVMALGGGAGGAGGLNTHSLATIDSIMRGHGAANGFLNSVGASSVAFNLPFEQAANLALADRGMGVLERLAQNGGTVADLAAARALTAQLGQGAATAGAAATKLSGLQHALAGLANMIV